jgi:acetyl-CoA C-acetyltransferase
MRKVAIVGVGTIPWRSRYEDKTWLELGFQAAKNALDDAHLAKDDIDMAIYSTFCELMLRQQIMCYIIHEYLGLQAKPSLRPNAAGAADMASLYTGYCEVASGMSDIVLVLALQKGSDLYCSETRSRGDGFLRGIAFALDTTWLQQVVPGPAALMTASMLIPHMEKYGSPTLDQLARVSVKNHKNALGNPEAQLKTELTIDDVLNSRIIAWPTTKYQCCLYSDSAAALILAPEEKAKEMTDKPIWLSGIAECSYPSMRFEERGLGRIEALEASARKAYAMAGIRDPAGEIDVAEIYDLISGVEILSYEELGFCERGKGGAMVEEGLVEKRGKLPVNLTGGRVAAGHVGGVSAAYSAATVVRQLREEAGSMQVPIHSGKGLVDCMDGYGSICGVTILER